jgi:D-sedoheptulose 7-phosphate isomerase
MKKKNILEKSINDNIKLKLQLLNLKSDIDKGIKIICESLKNKGKIIFCGNGGSAADAQHLVAELLIRLKPTKNRKSLPAISLALDTSTLTACGNDYNFDYIFSRPLESLGNKEDVLIAISTSGNSKNIINVLKVAKKKGIKSIGFLGNSGGKSKKLCNISLVVPSKKTARIQECHIFLGHHILEMVENKIFYK